METRDRRFFETLWWGGVLIWAGVVYGADRLGYLPQIGEAEWWSWAFLGAGAYSLLIDSFRLSSPSYSNARTWEWVLGGVLALIGLGGFLSATVVGELVPALALLLIGGAILISLLFRRS